MADKAIDPAVTADVQELELLEAWARGTRDQIGLLSETLKNLRRKGAIRMARAFVGIRQFDDFLDETVKQWKSFFDELKTVTLPEMMEAEGVTSLPLAEGYRVGMSARMYASIKEGQKEAAYEWLRNNGLGELITETVNASTLSAAAKHRLEEQALEMPDDLFNAMLKPNTSVTKLKAKA